MCVLDTVKDIAQSLRSVQKRSKSVLFIGTELTTESPIGECNALVRDARRRLFQVLDTVHVTVHVFDAAGLETGTFAASSNVRARDLLKATLRQPATGSFDKAISACCPM
ncbi:MAG: hypothetical protein IT184_16390 [Acidobacteria bacterium]|nr:hypothetical protein [Acidobacteriota bacterium]